MTQNLITGAPPVGMAGLIYDSSPANDIVTKTCQNDIPFGAVVRISGEYCDLPTTAAEITDGEVGVAVRNPTAMGVNIVANPTGTVMHRKGDPIPVMVRGRIWAPAEQAMAAQANPFVRFGGTGQKGSIRNDADIVATVAGAAQPPGMSVYRGSGAPGLVVLQLNHPGVGTGT
jgi:hypothetical protein